MRPGVAWFILPVDWLADQVRVIARVCGVEPGVETCLAIDRTNNHLILDEPSPELATSSQRQRSVVTGPKVFTFDQVFGPEDSLVCFIVIVIAFFSTMSILWIVHYSQACFNWSNNNTWKLHLARQALQPSWRCLTSLTAQSTGMLFSSLTSWAAGDWWRRPGMFEHLRFYSNGFPLWCNVLNRFCCTNLSSMTTGQSMVHYQTNFVMYFCNFWDTTGFPLTKIVTLIR